MTQHIAAFDFANTLQNVKQAVAQNDFDASVHILENAQQILRTQLGNVLLMQADSLCKTNQCDAAINALQQAANMLPDDVRPWQMMAQMYHQQQQWRLAIAAHQQVLHRAPQSFEALYACAHTCLLGKEYTDATAYIEQALAIEAQHMGALQLYARILEYNGALTQARQVYADLLPLCNKDLDTYLHAISLDILLGYTHHAAQMLDALRPQYDSHPQFIKHYIATLTTLPVDAQGNYFEKGYAFAKELLQRHIQAVSPNSPLIEGWRTQCDGVLPERATKKHPAPSGHPSDRGEFYAVAGDSVHVTLQQQYIHDAYILQMARAFLRVADVQAFEQLGGIEAVLPHVAHTQGIGVGSAFMAHVRNDAHRAQLLQVHRTWGQSAMNDVAQAPITRTPKAPRQKLRIGIMSAHMRNHVVGYFLAPLFAHYPHTEAEIFCYSLFTGAADACQQQFAQQVDEFKVITHTVHQDVAQLIADDTLDVLIETDGATSLSRPHVLAFRPAPVHISWLGYPHSLGLPTIDYMITDPYLCPTDPQLLLEKPLAMPHTWFAIGDKGFNVSAIIDPSLPSQRNQYITFGTMNSVHKYSALWLETVAKILQQVPESRFLFVRPEAGFASFVRNMHRFFAQHEIPPSRLMFIAAGQGHLNHYNQIDVALDTFPHTGGTTTCETLWMGVPVITLVGSAMFERISHSVLHNAGVPQWSCYTIEQYIAQAIEMAYDTTQRQYYKNTLRAHVQRNPLGQGRQFAHDFVTMLQRVV